MIALEWSDIDLAKRQLCVQRSDWNGQVTIPKGGRLRYIPLTVRLMAALREHRHQRSSRVLCQDDGHPSTRQQVQYRVKRAARRARVWNASTYFAIRSVPIWRCVEHPRGPFKNSRATVS
jgi:integrase